MISRYRFFVVFAVLLSACSTVPLDQPKIPSHAFHDTSDTTFGQVAANWEAEHPDGESGFYSLRNGIDALGARLRMIEGAERSVDAQYFLMKDDEAGEMIAGSLLAAADRGVRVRLLLDDVFTTVKDDLLALLDNHPNIEVRIYNPVSRWGLYYLNYVGDFSRANRRMHSKSLTADNAFTIVGGRNIADEYFQLREDTEFLDYEVLALGPIASEVSTQFDVFWNSERAVPIEVLTDKFSAQDLARERAEVTEALNPQISPLYRRAINTELLRGLLAGTGVVYAAHAELLRDGPSKVENPTDISQMTLVSELANFIAGSSTSVFVITPYFIPTRNRMSFWRYLIERGMAVTIVTNSLASTNHVPVHAAYSRYRKELLEMGVTLYEVRANAVEPGNGVERLTLHTKLMLIDERYLFVGSLNLDPRSIDINAEMGLLIDSQAGAAQFMTSVTEAIEKTAYRVDLDPSGHLNWHATIDGEEVIETSEPLASWWRKMQTGVYRLLPEGQL